MGARFKSKTVNVLIIDGNSSSRQMMTDIFKGLGFKNVATAPDIKSGVGVIEVEDIQWVITRLFDGEEANAMQLLKLFRSHKELISAKVSLIVGEDSEFCLPKAFELGLMTYHKQLEVKSELEDEFANLVDVFEKNDWNSCQIASHYLRQYLGRKDLADELLTFHETLSEVFPENGRVFLGLADAQARNKLIDSAVSSVRKAEYLDKDLDVEVAELQGRFPELKIEAAGEEKNILGVKTAMVVTADSSIREAFAEIFKEFGVPEVLDFKSGKEVLNKIEADSDEVVVVCDWALKDMPTPMLLQRVRQQGFHSIPLVAVATSMNENDIPIAMELGLAGALKTPLKQDEASKNLLRILQQEKLPSEPAALERKIRQLLSNGKYKGAFKRIKEYSADPDVPKSKKLLLEAEYAFHKGRYAEAKEKALTVLNLAGESIHTLNLLSNCLLKLREFDQAMRVLDIAQSLSPLNVERVCQMAGAQLEMGNEEEAEKKIKEAEDLDEDSPVVVQTKVNSSIMKGDTEAAKASMAKMPKIDKVLSFMNNRAVALSKCEKVKEGVDLYNRTLKSIPDNLKLKKVSVQYNLALAHIRGDEYDEAIKILDSVIKAGKSRIGVKAKSLKARIKKATDSGMPFSLRESEGSAGNTGRVSKDEIVSSRGAVEALSGNMGDMCCLYLYKATGENRKSLDMMKKKLNFKPREGIVREETLGVERKMQTA